MVTESLLCADFAAAVDCWPLVGFLAGDLCFFTTGISDLTTIFFHAASTSLFPSLFTTKCRTLYFFRSKEWFSSKLNKSSLITMISLLQAAEIFFILLNSASLSLVASYSASCILSFSNLVNVFFFPLVAALTTPLVFITKKPSTVKKITLLKFCSSYYL
jgi:hypothetical protein